LVTSLQQAHNWTAKNDRNKMSFWNDVLFEDGSNEDADGSGFRPYVCRTEIEHWLERNSVICEKAKVLLTEYVESHENKPPGIPAPISPLSWNWIPRVTAKPDDPKDHQSLDPKWLPEEQNKFEQDKAWGRVSHEIDEWWQAARDQNCEEWTVPMPSKEYARTRQESYTANIETRYAPRYQPEDEDPLDDAPEVSEVEDPAPEDDESGSRSVVQEYVDNLDDDDDLDDNDSYGEGPMAGLLTEIPNILDPKQIEALHMIIKSCILDSMGSGLTRYGENLQKTRSRMLLALETGRALLREILVFIAVWDKDEESLIFEITTSIVEALHEVALIPYAWNCLRIPKDVISPAQAVLLRLINHMFRKRYINSPSPQTIKDDSLDIKAVHYLFSCIRTRIVPECLAILRLQGEIQRDDTEPSEFPLDNWDMERAREGLAQVLDFLFTVSEIDGMRAKLIDWDGTFELIQLLKGLEDGVPKKPLVDPAKPTDGPPVDSTTTTPAGQVERPYIREGSDAPPPPPPPPPPPHPPAQEYAHKFPWAGIKIQVLAILANMLQPAKGKIGPGNPKVQAQVMEEHGIVPLLNACTYDDHNRFTRERVQLCLKYLMDGSEEANNFLRELVKAPSSGNPDANSSTATASFSEPVTTTTKLTIDGKEGEVKVQLRTAPPIHAPNAPPAGTSVNAGRGSSSTDPNAAPFAPFSQLPPLLAQLAERPALNLPGRAGVIYNDVMAIGNEAAQLVFGKDANADAASMCVALSI
jgi:palmitoyltransferase